MHGVGGRICCLQEMYYRHLYATVQPTLEQRCESWDNYCALFNIILTSSINMQVGCQTSPLSFQYCQSAPATASCRLQIGCDSVYGCFTLWGLWHMWTSAQL